MAESPHIITIFAVNLVVLALVVIIHYECLFFLSRLIPRLRVQHRYRILIGAFGAIFAHTMEVWIFALAYFCMCKASGWGQLIGNTTGTYFDCVYYSFTTFSTLGYGDIVPVGAIRYLMGLESLVGIFLIAWSASFLFMDMERHWGERESKGKRK